MLTVLITYLDGTTDLKDYHTLSDISLVGVASFKVIRDERPTARVA